MKSSVLIFNSSTNALKAQKMLISLGYKATTEKANGGSRGGCQSAVRVNEEGQKVCSYLSKNGIYCNKYINK